MIRVFLIACMAFMVLFASPAPAGRALGPVVTIAGPDTPADLLNYRVIDLQQIGCPESLEDKERLLEAYHRADFVQFEFGATCPGVAACDNDLVDCAAAVRRACRLLGSAATKAELKTVGLGGTTCSGSCASGAVVECTSAG